ncbi:MAG: KEOPS complex subunit Pcc1 [Promethearchaeota archaeon]
MNSTLKICFTIRYDSEDQARVIFSSVFPEIQDQRFERSTASIALEAQIIIINITAYDVNAAKATIGSILRWISSTTRALMTLSKQTFN